MDRKAAAIRTRSNSLIQGAAATATAMQSGGAVGTNANGVATTTTRTRHKSGNASYADLITRAILSCDEKRLTLSEIYDWMVDNVPGLKDQRYLHSAKGWKNAVRHTLSINPRFRKLARLGRPGWWTVDSDFVHRSSLSQGQVQPTSTPSYTTSTALIWDAHQPVGQQSQTFRGRLSSAPALFLSPIFATTAATAATTPLTNCFPTSRPPSSMSILSGSGASSPRSEFSSTTIVSSPPLLSDTQTVQIWRDQGGVGLLAVPRPLPVRVANVSEIATQTEEATNNFDESIGHDRRLRNVCDYFENVSPVSSPLTSILARDTSPIEPTPTPIPILQREQTTTIDQHRRHQEQRNVRVSLAQFDQGKPILILTNTTVSESDFQIPIYSRHPSNGSGLGSDFDDIKSISGSDIDTASRYRSRTSISDTDIGQRCRPSISISDTDLDVGRRYANFEVLPEDLEGIDIDPSVRCDVVAVIKYEQNLGRVPKTEPESSRVGFDECKTPFLISGR